MRFEFWGQSPVSPNSGSRTQKSDAKWHTILNNLTNVRPDSCVITSYLACHWSNFSGYYIIYWNLNLVKPDSDLEFSHHFIYYRHPIVIFTIVFFNLKWYFQNYANHTGGLFSNLIFLAQIRNQCPSDIIMADVEISLLKMVITTWPNDLLAFFGGGGMTCPPPPEKVLAGAQS